MASRGTVVRLAGVVPPMLAVALTLGACGSSSTPVAAPSAPAAPAAPASSSAPPDPAVKNYCAAVARVQAEQSSPQAGQGGVAAASEATRRQLSALVATAPPEIAGDWQVLRGLTDRALGSLASTGGDPRRIDHATLDRLSQQAQPTVARIKSVTAKRCGINFQAPGAAPAR